jgi:SAM-dependent methyltransferase
VLSLSNNHAIDGNLHVGFGRYMEKIVDLLKPGGYLLFESHNAFAAGGIGDAIMNKRFDIERYRMVRCYLKYAVEDLDKLFIVAKRSEFPRPVRSSLPEAREKYEWS